MAKKGRLSKEEQNSIQSMLAEGYDINAICQAIDRTEASVSKYADSVKTIDDEDARKAWKAKQKKLKAKDEAKQQKMLEEAPKMVKDLMVMKTTGGQNKGVSMMTEAASARGDETRDAGDGSSRITRGAIHIINNDE